MDIKAQEYAKQLGPRATNSSGRKAVIEYLSSRGINGRIAAKYKLGFVDRPAPDDERFAGALAIPYITRAGVRAIKYRCVTPGCSHKEHGGKYMQPSGQPKGQLYNSAAFHDADETIGMCEGEIDAIVATELVGIPTLGMPGATYWTGQREVWLLTLKNYSSVIYFADGDTAGLGAAREVLSDLGQKGKIVKCEADEDVASMVVKHGPKLLRQRAGLEDEDD